MGRTGGRGGVLALLAAALWLLGAGAPSADDGALSVGDFRKLPVYASQNGELNVTLVAAPKAVAIDGVRLNTLTFNGEYGGPALRLKPGDRLRIHLVNHTALPINLHFHGSYASPRARGDNVHIEVGPGTSFDYRLTIPLDQPPGLYWYHTHIHGISEQEVNGGLSCAMIIDGIEQQVPETAGLRQRLLVLKTYTIDSPPDARPDPAAARLHGVVQSINGGVHEQVRATAGATEFWRLTNQSPNDYYHLSIKGVRFRIVGLDGAPTRRDIDADHLDIAPAGRVEALVTMPAAGDYPIVSGSTPTGTGRNLKVVRELAVLKVEGPSAAPAAPPPLADVRRGPAPPDLSKATITARRTMVFSQAPNQEIYLINGQTFDHDRIDVQTPLGSIEEWTIRNDTDDMHVFHIHQLHFQVVSINGAAQPFDRQLDTVRIPERGQVVIRIPFTDPQMVGHFVYHCHVLKHEDKGMMANIEVYDPKVGPDRPNSADFGYRGRPWWQAWLAPASYIGGYICHTPASLISPTKRRERSL